MSSAKRFVECIPSGTPQIRYLPSVARKTLGKIKRSTKLFVCKVFFYFALDKEPSSPSVFSLGNKYFSFSTPSNFFYFPNTTCSIPC
jgi:hypothetical protein